MIVTRFPPSPTGFLHVGGLRTALYNYLFARQNNGRFIFRIEDTDQNREVAGAVPNLIKTLSWAGLNWDEGPDIGGPHGPYVQSERTEIYRAHVEELLRKGHAYYCFCTKERLEKMRAEQTAKKLPPMYDRACLALSLDEIDAKRAAKVPAVIRQKIPEQENVAFEDIVRGEVSFRCKDLDDHVLMKSDGFPTYHLANVIDDHLMEITHVIRGEEWLSSAPKHVLLYEAFAWEKPTFAHLPLLLNKDKSKLSKRQNDVAVEDYIQKGYLKEAILNFIALLGWHPGETEQEIFSMDELLKLFSLDKIHKSGAIFDLEKLNWMNWQWRRKKYHEDPRSREEKLYEVAKIHLKEGWEKDRDFLNKVLKTVEEKILQDPSQTQAYISFYFSDDVETPPALITNEKMKVDAETAKRALVGTRDFLEIFDGYEDEEKIKSGLSGLVQKLGVKNGQVFWPVRAALTGEQYSPGVFEVIWALGKGKTLARLSQAIERLS